MIYTIEELQHKFNEEIAKRLNGLDSQKPEGLYRPVSYSLEEGGKRLRPLLLLMAYNLFKEDVDAVLPAAVAIEVFHNFTLLHDDIMDKAEVRRNKPTVHIKFNENKAILSGDAMAFLTYKYLMECSSERLPEVIHLFTRTALEVCEGQQLDMDFETSSHVTEEEYLEMIRLKTAVLLGCSLKSGSLLADASEKTAHQLYELGICMGLAFQIQDDWLDAFGNSKIFGKRIGGDIIAGKKTYLLIKAMEQTSGNPNYDLNQLFGRDNGDSEEKIKSVVGIYENHGIKKLAEEKINALFTKATTILQNLELDESRKIQLSNLIGNMHRRSQ